MAAIPARQAAATARRPLQWALDFFAPEPELPAQAGKTATPPPPAPVAPHTREPSENPAPPTLPDEPDAFRHPRATREIRLDGRLVAYEVRRRKRRTIGFSVGGEGLAVSVPKGLSLQEADQAVRGKSGWILKNLHEARERHRRLQAQQTDWRDGAVFAFLGEPVRLALDAHLVPGTLLDSAPAAPGSGAMRLLRLKLPADAPPEQVRQAVQAWLMQEAMQLFTRRLDFFAPQLPVQWRKLGLSSASTRWGSASSSGAIRLNWRLMHLKPALIDYVVVHELSHLRFMDHSPRFWATVQAILPDHGALRRALRQESLPRG